MMDKVIRGSLPSLQILATAFFVNTVLSIFNGQKESKAILLLQTATFCGQQGRISRPVRAILSGRL